uniref:Uncharacterized protein n=1 Tax=Haemonchus contortus TaxID=6289 RepID=W6NBV1_HAECO
MRTVLVVLLAYAVIQNVRCSDVFNAGDGFNVVFEANVTIAGTAAALNIINAPLQLSPVKQSIRRFPLKSPIPLTGCLLLDSTLPTTQLIKVILARSRMFAAKATVPSTRTQVVYCASVLHVTAEIIAKLNGTHAMRPQRRENVVWVRAKPQGPAL